MGGWMNEWILIHCELCTDLIHRPFDSFIHSLTFPGRWLYLTSLGGCLFTTISMVIPPLLHLVCFHKTMSAGKKQFEFIAMLLFFVFMILSTVFSAIALFSSP